MTKQDVLDDADLQGIKPMQRRTLHDDVVGRLRDLVIEGKLAPGMKIHEGQLCAAFGISRTPLREAIKSLASEGLIELVPARGAVIKALTKRDVRNMLDVLIALEALAARLVCKEATDHDIAHVRALHDEMMGFYTSRNRLEYYKRNQAIHTSLAQLSGNDFLASTHETIQSRLKRIRFVGNEEPSKWQGAVEEHEQMIAALEARDADRLAEVVSRHLERTWDRVKDIV
jgi:DNA-binding GntR family transcriptional regulator